MAQSERVQPPAGADSQGSPETVFWDGHGRQMPAQLGPYRFKKKLGGGGMGAVFLVENTNLRRDEALKVPHFESAGDPAVRERFLREARAAAQLEHPNLCPIYAADAIDGIYFLTMRLLPGKPLSDWAGRALPPRKAVEIVVKLAQAMQHAHEKGVIHRDLKPSNVMMCPGTGPTVLDFGLARQTGEAEARLTQTGTTLGTPAYMPPEQVKGELSRIGPASDVYSLGVIFVELLTGKLPFVGVSGEVMGRVLYVEAPLPSTLQPGLGPAFDALCRKALAKKPEDRFPSMESFAAELLAVLRTLPKAPETVAAPAATGEKKAIFAAPTVVPVKPPSTISPEKDRPLQPVAKESKWAKQLLLGSLVAMLGLCLVLLCWGLSRGGGQKEPDKNTSSTKSKGDTPDVGEIPREGLEISNSIGMKLVGIPPGTFIMGSPEGEEGHAKDEDQHEVEISKKFWLGMNEVTQKQFKAIMGYNPSYFSRYGASKEGLVYLEFARPAGGKGKVPEDTSDFPVENVSWQEANEFCDKLTKKEGGGRTYRLPTEAEWEYSCRGGAPSYQTFHFGKSLSSKQANFNGELGRTCQVGSYEKNRFGLYDMHGNVWEWCSDWYSKPTEGVYRVARGGSWSPSGMIPSVFLCRSAHRSYRAPAYRDHYLGFRVALVPSGK